MSFKITPFTVGLLETNCYIVTADNGDIAVIDPGDDPDKILNRIRDKENVKYIFATHGHIDHVGALLAVKKNCPKAKVFLPKKDIRFSPKPKIWGVLSEVTLPTIDIKYTDLKEGKNIPFGSDQFRVIRTPGHTPGSVCLLLDHALFSGDTLFYRSLGTTQFPGGDDKMLTKSKKKLSKLPPDTIVYPGHLRETSIRMEKRAGIL
jgi:hydroxyacylglutathione hydrolase